MRPALRRGPGNPTTPRCKRQCRRRKSRCARPAVFRTRKMPQLATHRRARSPQMLPRHPPVPDRPCRTARAGPPAPSFSRRGGAGAPELVPFPRERSAPAQRARTHGAALFAVRRAGNTIRPARSPGGGGRSTSRHPLRCAWPRLLNRPKFAHRRSTSAVRCSPLSAATTKAVS